VGLFVQAVFINNYCKPRYNDDYIFWDTRMIFRSKLVLFFALTLLTLGCNERQEDTQNTKVTQQKGTDNTVKESTSFLSGFELCKISESLLETRRNLIMNAEPLKKYNSFLSYKLETRFMELPIKIIIFGICSDITPASNDCAMASNVTLVLDTNFDDAKNHLLKMTGMDYSQEKRSPISGGLMLRPHLYEGDDNSVILYCDTGEL